MVSKLNSGSQTQLICCDCGLRLGSSRGPRFRRRGLLITVVLLALFSLTAGGLMLLWEQHNPSLLDEEGLNLNEPRDPTKGESKRWILVPRLPLEAPVAK